MSDRAPADGFVVDEMAVLQQWPAGVRQWVVWSAPIPGHPQHRWLYADGHIGYATAREGDQGFRFLSRESAEAALTRHRLGGRELSDCVVDGFRGHYVFHFDTRTGRYTYLTADRGWVSADCWLESDYCENRQLAQARLDVLVRGDYPLQESSRVVPVDESKYMTTVPPDNRGGFLE